MHLVLIFQTAVITSLAYGSYGNTGCTGFTYDTSSLEDDSDYHVDASGGDNYDVGDDLRLKVHVHNDWELKVSWNASKYQNLAPVGGWNYKVLVTVNSTYQTQFGEKFFTRSTEVDTNKNHETFPLYNPSSTYTVTVLAATRTRQCLGERKVITDLPGREDAIAHVQMRLKFYTYWPCERKLQKKDRVLAQFNHGIFDALKRHQERFGILLNLSQYKLTDLDVMCLRDDHKDSRVAVFTGRIIAIGNTSNTQFISTMQSWVSTQPTLPIRKDSVVVDKTCPVYYVPASGEYCMHPEVTDNVTISEANPNSNNNSSGLSRGVVIVVVVIGVLLVTILLALGICVCRASRHKIFSRAANFSFRSQTSVTRRLRINNVLADIESIDSSGNRSPDNVTTSELHRNSSHQHSKGT